MLKIIAALVSGLIFGVGLIVSGMINPEKVLRFLDVTGKWDPSLAFVMVGAIAVTAIGYRIIEKKRRPVFAGMFYWPTARQIDAPLLAGAAVFGVGWGLSGFCPGPVLASLSLGRPGTVVFILAMLVGIIATRFFFRQKTVKKVVQA